MWKTVLIKSLPAARLYSVAARLEYGPIRVPVGFKTDGATIPRPFWLTTGTPFRPEYIRAAIVHDYLYQTGQLSRLEADSIFRMILLEDGTGRYQAFKMFWALRAFGWLVWRKYRRNKSNC